MIHNISNNTDSIDKAMEIHKYFAMIGSNLAKEIPNIHFDAAFLLDRMPPAFEFHELTHYGMAVLIRDSKSSNSRMDVISSRLLNEAGPGINLLVHIVNLSIRTEIFPAGLEIGCITPIFKEGDTTDPSNYHPISVLLSIGKLLECAIYSQLYDYFTRHSLFCDAQSGFRKGHSTSNCLLDFLDNIQSSINEGDSCGVLFLDL